MDAWEYTDSLILRKLPSLEKVTLVWVLTFPEEIQEQESLMKIALLPGLDQKGILETTSFVLSH